ncbi:MAG: PTS sugar transporter subunit IIB [Erysipelothrix sp.]|jgi:PTS system cellobiose-specific IIB component|nr:PTS sugar transporter subunit IIB [Erysipelothrix sp.]
MKSIVLLCSAGMSTNLLLKKMKLAALEFGVDVQIEALPLTADTSVFDKADVVLVGPQIRSELTKIQSVCQGKVDAINIVDYGTMDGEKVLAHALRLLGPSHE